MSGPEESTAANIDKEQGLSISVPTFSTDELEIGPAVVEPMGHGGHSLVYKVKAKGFPDPSVLKIFRFTIPLNPAYSTSSVFQSTHPRDPDYVYFLSEKSCYTRLQARQNSQSYTPKLYAIVTVSPSLEPHLLSSYNPAVHRRKRQSHFRDIPKDQIGLRLPLKGLLIEHISGLRLSAFHSIPSSISQKIIDGIEHIHSAGILHRDIKKRNVLVVPNTAGVPSGNDEEEKVTAKDIELDGTEKVVWIDFSNSLTLSDFIGTNDEREDIFSQSIEGEMNEVHKMISRLER